ncbi:hypothetical protein L873DRAFT_1813951 [Choiromyces venosus 120613-1]|uniref:Uncharacterized protein n=1 Tax=Choiromyces venosus 120613-1 TaxID=1336337 RepID=A0A3N4JBL6_9PEZI|nr:hypothetical protein L873DRAFT_1813951 [Choiromyces venosus 120613-1]
MQFANPQTPIKAPMPVTPAAPRRTRIHNSEFPESPTPGSSRGGILFRQQPTNETGLRNPRSSSSVTWDQSTYNATLNSQSISNATSMPTTPQYYPGSPRQLLSPSGVPTTSKARHPPQCTPNFEEARKIIRALDCLLEEVRLLKADTFFGNPIWGELNTFYKDFKEFLDQESDGFFIFVEGASVATDADLEGLNRVSQTILDAWIVMRESVLRNDPEEGSEDKDAIVIDQGLDI